MDLLLQAIVTEALEGLIEMRCYYSMFLKLKCMSHKQTKLSQIETLA